MNLGDTRIMWFHFVHLSTCFKIMIVEDNRITWFHYVHFFNLFYDVLNCVHYCLLV